MIGYTSLWEVIRTDLLGTVTCTNLALTQVCFRIMTLLHLDI